MATEWREASRCARRVRRREGGLYDETVQEAGGALMGFALMIAVAVLAGWLAERRGYTSVIYGTIAFLLYAGTAMWAGEEQRHQEAREALRVAAYGGVQREVPFEYGWPLLGAMAGIALPLMLPDRAGKQCPQCAERVKYAATVCRYCQHRFAAAGETTPPG